MKTKLLPPKLHRLSSSLQAEFVIIHLCNTFQIFRDLLSVACTEYGVSISKAFQQPYIFEKVSHKPSNTILHP